MMARRNDIGVEPLDQASSNLAVVHTNGGETKAYTVEAIGGSDRDPSKEVMIRRARSRNRRTGIFAIRLRAIFTHLMTNLGIHYEMSLKD
jgi:hypothetical protein